MIGRALENIQYIVRDESTNAGTNSEQKALDAFYKEFEKYKDNEFQNVTLDQLQNLIPKENVFKDKYGLKSLKDAVSSVKCLSDFLRNKGNCKGLTDNLSDWLKKNYASLDGGVEESGFGQTPLEEVRESILGHFEKREQYYDLLLFDSSLPFNGNLKTIVAMILDYNEEEDAIKNKIKELYTDQEDQAILHIMEAFGVEVDIKPHITEAFGVEVDIKPHITEAFGVEVDIKQSVKDWVESHRWDAFGARPNTSPVANREQDIYNTILYLINKNKEKFHYSKCEVYQEIVGGHPVLNPIPQEKLDALQLEKEFPTEIKQALVHNYFYAATLPDNVERILREIGFTQSHLVYHQMPEEEKMRFLAVIKAIDKMLQQNDYEGIGKLVSEISNMHPLYTTVVKAEGQEPQKTLYHQDRYNQSFPDSALVGGPKPLRKILQTTEESKQLIGNLMLNCLLGKMLRHTSEEGEYMNIDILKQMVENPRVPINDWDVLRNEVEDIEPAKINKDFVNASDFGDLCDAIAYKIEVEVIAYGLREGTKNPHSGIVVYNSEYFQDCFGKLVNNEETISYLCDKIGPLEPSNESKSNSSETEMSVELIEPNQDNKDRFGKLVNNEETISDLCDKIGALEPSNESKSNSSETEMSATLIEPNQDNKGFWSIFSPIKTLCDLMLSGLKIILEKLKIEPILPTSWRWRVEGGNNRGGEGPQLSQ
jgi:hypothetical protein